jgi:pimeloyl-ACP methyl ester carboxylesterase
MDRWVLDNPQPDYARGRQAQASLGFDSEQHLDKINSPTLILHGQKDNVVPPENADMLLESISNSKLVLFEDGPHRIEVERHLQFNQTILDFYKQVDSGTFTPEPRRTILTKS